VAVGSTTRRPKWVQELYGAIGHGRIVSDGSDLLTYGRDESPDAVLRDRIGDHRYLPDIAACPTDAAGVAAVLAVARRHRIPVTPRGLGSSVTGQPLPQRKGIVLDLAGLVDEPRLDRVDLLVTVGAGMRGSDLEAWLNGVGLTLNHMPQSLARSSVGGWIATRATGQLSSRFGGIEDLVAGYDVLLVDGTRLSMGARPRAAVGPDLSGLFIGSEGTLGVVVQVTLKVFPLPEQKAYEAFLLPDISGGLAAMRAIMQAGIRPALLRFYDAEESGLLGVDLETGGCILFLGTECNDALVAAEHAAAVDLVEAAGGRTMGGQPVQAWLHNRFDFSAIEAAREVTGGFAETIEVASRWSVAEDLHFRLRDALTPLADGTLGHFSHAYHDGVSLYVIVIGRVADDAAALERLGEIWDIAMKVTLAMGGEVSHHHGIGIARSGLVPEALGERHALLRGLKAMLDPMGILNPGKLDLDGEH
jgi:alkyldihydroxyacetonephosphate synthase